MGNPVAKSVDHSELWPVDLQFLREKGVLSITYNDGRQFELPFELLRVESPSAEVQGHGARQGSGQKQTVPGKRNIGIDKVTATGNYAVRIVFDDGHDAAIYSWDYLYELGTHQDARWANYMAALTEKGLSRDPPG